MANTLAVKVTADIVDLQVQFSTAKATVNSLTAELNKLAKASSQAPLSPADTAKMRDAATAMLTAKVEAQALAGKMQEAGISATSLGRSLEGGHGSISTATREFRALFDELSSGRFHQAPGTIAILLQRVAGLSPAMLGAVGGVLALAGGLAFLAWKASQAAEAINQIDVTSAFAGNLDITRTAIQRYVNELEGAGHQSQAEAAKIVKAFAEVPGMTNAALATLTAGIVTFAKETGQDADKAAESLAKLFGGQVSATEFTKKLSLLTQLSQGQIDDAAAADRSGDASRVLTDKLTLLNQVIAAGVPTLKSYATSADDIAVSLAAGEAGADQAQLAAQMALIEAGALDKAAEARRRYIAVQAQTKETPEQATKAGIEVADKENPVQKQIRDVTAEIAVMERALKEGGSSLSQLNVDELKASIEKAHEQLDTLTLGPVMARMRDAMAGIAANWDGLQSGMLTAQLEVASKTLASVGANAKQRVEIETQVKDLIVKIHKAEGSEVLAQIRTQNTQIAGETSLSAVQRLQAERDSWVQALSNDKVVGAARIEAAREFNSTLTSIQKATFTETQAIERSNANTDIAIARLTIDAKKIELNEELGLHQISAQQKLALLKGLAIEEEALAEQDLDKRLAQLPKETAAYAEVYNQIRELKAKLNLDLATMDRQAAADAGRQAKQQSAAWKAAVGEIESAESSMISQLLSGRKSFGAAALNVAGQLVTKEIENDVKAVSTRLLLGESEETQKKALQEGGIAYHAFVESTKTGQTAAGATTRTLAETGEQGKSGLLERLAAGAHTQAEAQKTATTQTSAATRSTTETTEQAKSKVLEQSAASSHTVAEAQKTATTQTGATTRTGVETAEQVRARTLDQSAPATRAIAEAAKTAATTRGAAARTSTETIEQARARILEQAGASAHTGAEIQKTTVTHTGVATRTAAETTESTNIFSIIARTIARWFGFESSKTGATTAGVVQRTTDQAAGDAAAIASAKITALNLITDYAATGAAAAGASVAAIPIYGWAEAGPTATATYADLLAYAAALSFDKGTMEVARDQVANIHKGEIIIPPRESGDLRATGAQSFSHIVELARAGAQVGGDSSSAQSDTTNFFANGLKMPGLAAGSINVARDQVAAIHEGEMVLPAAHAEALRSMGVDSFSQVVNLAHAGAQGDTSNYVAAAATLPGL
jgi:hypothetical protein